MEAELRQERARLVKAMAEEEKAIATSADLRRRLDEANKLKEEYEAGLRVAESQHSAMESRFRGA